MNNIFSVDVEDWFHTTLLNGKFAKDQWSSLPSTIEHQVSQLLKILRQRNTQATFFVLGWMAEHYPGMIREIHRQGHEIASHGCSHKPVWGMSAEEFREDIIQSKKILEDITQTDVIGYRAPSWSVTRRTPWALEILRDCGYQYDSSVSLSKAYLGIFGQKPIQSEIGEEQILEFPQSSIDIFRQLIPFSGGQFLRMFPYIVIKQAAKRLNTLGNRVIFYCHPWEISPVTPAKLTGKLSAIVQNWNTKQTLEKLNYLLEEFPCKSFQQHLSREYTARQKTIKLL